MTSSPIVPEDLLDMQLVGSPVVVGESVVAVVESVDPTAVTYRHRLARFPLRSAGSHGAVHWLTGSGPWSDTAPTANAEGRIAFLSTRAGTRQAYLVADDAPQPLAALDAPVALLAWYDERHLVARVDRPDPAAKVDAPVRVDWLRYKADGRAGFLEPTHELWLLGVDGSARLLHTTSDRIADFAVSGGSVAFVCESRHSDEQASTSEVRTVDPTSDPDRPATTVWSVDATITALTATSITGRLVAVSSAVSGQSVTPPQLWLLDGSGGAEQLLRDDVECERGVFSDSRPSGAARLVQPVDGSDELLFLHIDGLEQRVSAVDPDTREVHGVSPAGLSVTDFVAAGPGSAALCMESAAQPTELFRVDGRSVDAAEPERLSWLNDLTNRAVVPEVVQVMAPDGLTMDALLFRPRETQDDLGKLLIRIHGGPHGAWGNTFDLETQSEVGAGFTVLSPNLRGSAGRGTAMRALSVGEWGRADYADLMAVADWAVRSGAGQADRLYLAGGSYGGYLINWAVTQTDRFRAVVSERSVCNLLSKYGTSDNGFSTNRFEFSGLDVLDDSIEELLARSPIRHVEKISTPMLLTHGENDYRCPIEQSEQLFVALRRRGQECELIRYPRGSHGFTVSGRPDHRVHRLRAVLSWIRDH